MNRQERRRYNLVIFVLFGAFFVLFGGVSTLFLVNGDGPFSSLHPVLRAVLTVLMFGLLAGWGFTSLVGGMWLGSRFVSRQGKGFIIFACVLFLFTVQLFWLIGMFVTIPFAIHNVIFLRRNKGTEDFIQEPPVQSLGRRHVKTRAVHVVPVVVALVLILSAIAFFDHRSANRFFSTMEEAFAHAEENGNPQELGEVFFIDEHENTITVFSLRDDHLVVSHYMTEMRGGTRWYSGRGTSGHVSFFPGAERSLLHFWLNEEGVFGGHNRNFRESFGRRPLYGIYRHDVIRNLSINGTPVEHVFEHINERGERVFFWYISNIPPFTGSAEDIVISFDTP